MREKDFDDLLDGVISKREKEESISTMKLSAIFKKYYGKFKIIQESYSSGLSDSEREFNCYSKEIQALLTKAGKFQKDGSQISEYQIINEMYKASKRKTHIDTSAVSIENSSLVLSPTSDFKGSGGVKVSTNKNKKAVARNNVVVEPMEIENMPKAIDTLQREIKLFNKDGVIPVWNSYDEFSLNNFKQQASMYKVKVHQLVEKKLLTPAFNQEIIDYFNLWFNKASICEKVFIS